MVAQDRPKPDQREDKERDSKRESFELLNRKIYIVVESGYRGLPIGGSFRSHPILQTDGVLLLSVKGNQAKLRK
jgi:hypothetical protein